MQEKRLDGNIKAMTVAGITAYTGRALNLSVDNKNMYISIATKAENVSRKKSIPPLVTKNLAIPVKHNASMMDVIADNGL